MKSIEGLSVSDKCSGCDIQKSGFFCDLPDGAAQELEKLKITKVFEKGASIFAQGQPAESVYMLCQGRVKLSACSKDGKVIILGIVEAGEVLGLSSAMNNIEHESTAETLELSQVNLINREDLLRFLLKYPDACLNAARQLSRNHLSAHRQICSLGLSDSVSDKLAQLFLGWSDKHKHNGGPVHLKNGFTHEEIAEMIGVSRETVTRGLRFFRENGLVTLKGSELVIHDQSRLQVMFGSQETLNGDK